MQNTIAALQIVLALGLLNVWLVRFNRETAYRGGSARSMREEFLAYGLPGWSTYVIGVLKLGSALALIAGFWIPSLIFPAAALIVALMVGAISMHVKIRDPLLKSVPAVLMLAMSASVVYLTKG